MRKLLENTARRAIRYVSELSERRVTPTPEAVARLAVFDEPLPDGPTDPEDVIQRLDEFGSPATTAMAGPRFFGFVIGGTLPAALAAQWLASSWDQATGMYAATPAAATLEEVSRRWLVDLLNLPADCGAGFVTGGTMANFSALAAARHSVLTRVGWDIEGQGLFGAPPITVVVGDEVHPTLLKGLGLLGLGRVHLLGLGLGSRGRGHRCLVRATAQEERQGYARA